MKKRRRRSVPTIIHAGISIREIRPGYFMVDMMRDRKRERVCFDDLNTAKTHCELKARKIQNEGTSALSLTPDQRSDAAKAISRLNNRTTLLDAVEFWLMHNGGADGVTIRELGNRWLKAIAAAGCRETTIREREHKVNRLINALGDHPARGMTKDRLVKWLDEIGVHGVTRDGYRRCYRAMFQFAIDEKITEHNPAAQIKAIRADEKLPEPFTVNETAAIMAAAEKTAPIMTPWLAVQFFAGLRPGEAKGLLWENINFDERFIRVTPESSKVRSARIVEINDTMLVWLLPYRQPAGHIGITTQCQFSYYITKKIIPASGVKWKQDAPRKTFATMHFASHQDAAKTAAILGHTSGVDVLYRHYRGLATTKEAARYWKIMPEATAGKVIKFKTA